jgi:hypothetical protein
MRRVILGLALTLGVVAWAVARPKEQPAESTVDVDDLSDVHSESSAEYRYHTSSHTHWRQVALRR